MEISRTKLKLFIVAVNQNNPYDFQTIEMFRKIGEKVLYSMSGNSI